MDQKKVTAQSLLPGLMDFFAVPKHFEKVLPVIRRTGKLSLRLLDWFVVNFSAEHDVSYKLPDGSDFAVHAQYRAQLKVYSKKLFDPFRRKGRLNFAGVTGVSEDIETTIGQLCFFRWCIQNRVFEYVETHADEITANMRASMEDAVGGSDSTLVAASTKKPPPAKLDTCTQRRAKFVATIDNDLLDKRKKYVVSFN